MTHEELLELKQQIETSKIHASELKGKLDYLQLQLKEKWGCVSIEEAEKRVKMLDKKIQKLQEQIEEGTIELEKQLV